ncbi:MAG: sigma-70 family RNA polymerase sigma factor [Myxococcales bacterium]|nr:sigma-70 family RNA polymerase sigma factor [Myxococcales bacterium]
MADRSRIGQPAPTPQQLELVQSVRVPLRDLALSVARGAVTTEVDDLHQLAMEHALRLAPEYQPERGASFLTFVYGRVREVLENSLKPERRDHAYAAAVERGMRVVQEALELGDIFRESQEQRRERFTTARHALAGAAILGCYSEPDSPEDLVLLEEERARSGRAIEAARKRLDATSNDLLQACFWEDKSLAEAARQVGLDYDKARYRLKAALALIGKLLQAG